MPKLNLNFSIDKKIQKFALLIFVLSIILLPIIAAANIGVPDRLVPCGGKGQLPCRTCDLYTLAHNLIDLLLWGIATPLLVVALIAAGAFWLTSGGSEERVTKGRQILWSALWGFIIAFGAWVIINTILDTLAFQNPFYGGAWSDTNFCRNSPFDSGGNSSGGGTGGGGNSGLAIDQGSFVDGVDTSGAYFQNQPNEALSQDLAMTQPNFPANYNKQIDQKYGAMIDAAAAKYGADPILMRAIIMAESSGDPNATHQDRDKKSSFGLGQLRTDTAGELNKEAFGGLSPSQIAEKLFDPQTNIDTQARFVAQLQQKYNNDPVLVAGAYNGGPGANLPSRDCSTGTRWQCTKDCTPPGSSNCTANTGYQVTRNYTAKVTSLATSLRQ